MIARIAWRLFRHELQRGDLWVIAFAMILTVFSVVSLSGITSSVGHALQQRSSQLNAADLVVRTNRTVPAQWWQIGADIGVARSAQLQFNTMLVAGDAMQLVSIKAVDTRYPLRGQLTLQGKQSQPLQRVEAGQLFVEPALLQRLNIKIGDVVDVGVQSFTITGVVVNEPDAPLNLFGGMPRVLMSLADVPSTQVIQPGSQVVNKAMFAGSTAQLAQLRAALTPMLQGSDRIQELDRQTTLGATLDRAQRFILLAGLLGIILACAAAAVAAKRYAQRQRLSIAILKAMGLTKTQVQHLFFYHLASVVGLSSLIGMALGYLTIALSEHLMRVWLPDYTAEFSFEPFQLGLATALMCALLFAARPLWLMVATPALDVLRQGEPRVKVDAVHIAVCAIAVYVLMWFFSHDAMVSAVLFLACVAAAGVVFLLAAALLRYTKPLQAGQTSSVSLAIASLRRRLWPNAFQLVTFTLAIFLALLLFFLRTELISQWRAQLPDNAPNLFLVNIDPTEQAAIQQFFQQHAIKAEQFYPMVAGRVIAVNDEPLVEPDEATPQRLQQTKQREGFGRELNLTWTWQLPKGNVIEQGEWFNGASRAEVSVEQRQAQRLGLTLGDSLSFSIGGVQIKARVSSIRRVDWTSLQPNFFMVLSPDLMANLPATQMTAVRVSTSQQSLLLQLAKQWPTISQISVEQILQQVQQVIAQVSLALSFVLSLIVGAAALVLVAQLQTTIDERQREVALLRTLGATSQFLRRSVLFEFMLLGGLAGLLATLLSEAVLAALQQQLSGSPFALHWQFWLLGPSVGIAAVTSIGALVLQKVMRPTPAEVIRTALADH